MEQARQDADRTFRPVSLADFIGQSQLRESLKVYVTSAKARNEPIEHLLFCGPAGLGKTTFAGVVAAEMGAKMVTVNAPSLRTKGELASILSSLERGDILFIDEIHRLKPEMQELLYPVMEDFKLEIAAGESTVSVPLPTFTVIGATTHQGLLSRPMRERFGDVLELEPYTVSDLAQVVERAANRMKIIVSPGAAEEIARRSRGTPRIALRTLRRVRDHLLCNKLPAVDAALVIRTCELLGVDAAGLDNLSRRTLRLLCDRSKPTGLQAIASALGEAVETIEDAVEPFLLANGFIERKPSGRMATEKAKKHLAFQHS